MISDNPTATTTPTPYEAPGWARALRRFTDYVVYNFMGGPRPWKFS